MNEQEVDRQINQMVQFIKQEAEEKANEIRVAAEEEFNIEKLQMETEKQRIRKEYERKESQVEVKKKIEYSTELNAMRLKVLAAREEAIQGMLAEARATVGAVSASPAYAGLLVSLICQGVRKLEAKQAVVRLRGGRGEGQAGDAAGADQHARRRVETGRARVSARRAGVRGGRARHLRRRQDRVQQLARRPAAGGVRARRARDQESHFRREPEHTRQGVRGGGACLDTVAAARRRGAGVIDDVAKGANVLFSLFFRLLMVKRGAARV